MSRYRSSVIAGLVAFTLTSVLTYLIAESAYAASGLGFLFRHPEAISMEYRPLGTPSALQATAFPITISEYNSTDLTAQQGPIQQAPFIGNYTNIIYIESKLGANGIAGHAYLTYSNGIRCFSDAGYVEHCNTTDKKSDFAYLVMNRSYINITCSWCNPWTLPKAITTQLHEMGHVLGLAHQYSCGTDSVMHPELGGICGIYTELQDDEIEWINSNY